MPPPGRLAESLFGWPELGAWLADQHDRHGLTPDHFLTRMPVPLFWLAVHPPGRTVASARPADRVAALARSNHALAARGLPPQTAPWFAPHLPAVPHG